MDKAQPSPSAERVLFRKDERVTVLRKSGGDTAARIVRDDGGKRVIVCDEGETTNRAVERSLVSRVRPPHG